MRARLLAQRSHLAFYDGEQDRVELLSASRPTSPAGRATIARWSPHCTKSGQLAVAGEELAGLQLAVKRVGGPVSAWHLDRATACIAQAQGRYADAAVVVRRGYQRMRMVEPAPATGAYFALQCALAGHIGLTDEAGPFVRRPFDGPPRFRTIAAAFTGVPAALHRVCRGGGGVLPAGGCDRKRGEQPCSTSP